MTDAELARKLRSVRLDSKSLARKPDRDRAERVLEQMMVENAKQIIKALDRGEVLTPRESP